MLYLCLCHFVFLYVFLNPLSFFEHSLTILTLYCYQVTVKNKSGVDLENQFVMLSHHTLLNRTWVPRTLILRHRLTTNTYLSETWRSTDIYCYYSTPARRPSFFSQFVENVKQDMAKNKELKESLKKFREEREKLEQSEALQKARTKFQAVESEASKGSEVLKEKLGTIKDKVQEAIEEAGKSDIAKKAGELTEGIGKTARDAAESITEQSQKIGQSEAFKTISSTAKAVQEELRPLGALDTVYRKPSKLRKRKELSDAVDNRVIEPNQDATGMELHKDSRFYQSWQNFKDNNPYFNKVLDWKMKYDESENPVIRASRLLTEKVSDIMGGLFQKTELSETLTEICKLDPNFDKVEFLKDCETDFIPNIIEAMVQGNLEILKDWCHDGPYNILSKPILQARQMGAKYDSKVLDIDNVDLAMGKMMEQGPVLVITFTTQQVLCVRDSQGKILEGDPDKVLRVNYVWVMCRDVTEMDPRAAWRLLDLSANSQEQLL